ncbi:exodeoxyribonuclease VII small subunit [Cyanobium sp. Aljojuca 7D2]|uniref:exodeoxyribonuclease VII small subunit n=1 Tax=Cyanobium sp. Aljojuca 7D2 TaxID=2823698 RepID=UPI0020CCED0C|nr:exodeoxyribonuclease VII small subunit [Cyanobium sp. Aljojuca 7D2]MCP9891539.1 exodeoxyribonuclease VII small subunit [Cyanobium sp. Aljojuca 7D2]
MPKAKPRQTSGTGDQNAAATAAADLSYNEAQTALQLTLAALQANDLDVEEMTGLYRRARAYLERCESVLASVEQELLLWDDSNEAVGPMSESP